MGRFDNIEIMRSMRSMRGLRSCVRNFSHSPCTFINAPEITAESGRPPISNELRKEKRTVFRPIPSSLNENTLVNHELERLRVLPKLKTFYGGNPAHEENLNTLNSLIRKHINLPTRVVDDAEIQSKKFLSFEEYKEKTQSGTRLKPIHHKELTQLLHRLRSIDSQLMPKEVSEVLLDFTQASNTTAKRVQKLKTLDEFGRAKSLGKRKRSVAEVYLVKGEGQCLINGRSLTEYFPRDFDRKSIVYPFQVVGQEGQYNIFAKVHGGGITGQAEAVMYGIAKSLVIFNPLLKSRLKKASLMTRDTRKVERKKPGKVKARKSPTWVKR